MVFVFLRLPYLTEHTALHSRCCKWAGFLVLSSIPPCMCRLRGFRADRPRGAPATSEGAWGFASIR